MARHLVIVGSTASGKSDLALSLARARPGVEIVSADSMQVYEGMDIGTAKPSAEHRAAVAHHLIDVVAPRSRYTVANFAEAGRAVVDAIEARGHTAIVVGGTGLYVQALLGDLTPPGEFPEVRAELEREVSTSGARALHRRLQQLDPVAAGRMEPDNARRVVRALEVTLGAGVPFSSFGPGMGAYGTAARFAMCGVWLPRAVVATRVEQRVTDMIAAGLVDEVRSLELGPTARQALGYKEILAQLEDGTPIGECVDQIVRRTKQFSRRQRSWFGRDPRIRWYATASDPTRLLPGLLVELDACLPARPPGDALQRP